MQVHVYYEPLNYDLRACLSGRQLLPTIEMDDIPSKGDIIVLEDSLADSLTKILLNKGIPREVIHDTPMQVRQKAYLVEERMIIISISEA